MPLIEIHARQTLCPQTDLSVSLDEGQCALVELAEALPGLFIEHGDTLRIGSSTPEIAVQVTFAVINPHSVNAPDIWFKVTFTETQSQQVRQNVSMALSGIFSRLIEESSLDTTQWALDVFFGPGHGCLTDEFGKIVQRW